MFFLIPFGIFLVSLALMAWLVARKFVYLKKLAPGIIDSSDIAQKSFWVEFFPEFAGHLKMAKLQEYGAAILAEFEKFLRRLRLISLRIDTLMNRLIHRVRKTAVYHEEVLSKKAEIEEEKVLAMTNGAGKNDPKEEEQKLIIEIAKNPKNAELYKKLGYIYTRTEEWHDAVESFKKALELDPEDAGIKIKLERASKKLEKLPT